MLTKYTHKNITWIDLNAPTKEEVREVIESYTIHPAVANELLSPTLRAKVDRYPDFIYLILHFPTISHTHDGRWEQEVDFIIGKDFLITTHYDFVDPLHEFSKLFEVQSILDKSNFDDHAGFVFFHIIRELYKNLALELDFMAGKLQEVELNIFEGKETQMVHVISGLSRELLNFRQSIRYHKEVLESFELAARDFFGQEFSYYLRAILGEYYKIANMLEGSRDTLAELCDTNDSLLTTKTNSIMKMFTVMAFLILPPSLIAAVFSMSNVLNFPQVDFSTVVAVIAFTMGTIFLFFKYKKWI